MFLPPRRANTLSGFQRLLGVCGVLFGPNAVCGCVLRVVGHAGIGNGPHKTEAGILTTLQRLRHNYLDAVGEVVPRGCINHVFLRNVGEISWCFRRHSVLERSR